MLHSEGGFVPCGSWPLCCFWQCLGLWFCWIYWLITQKY